MPLPNSGAQRQGGDTIKVSQKKMEDMEEGSSSGKKQKRKEDEEAAEAEFSLVVEELWGKVARRWEELEQWQEQRWAAMTATLGRITDDVWELLDGLVLEKEKGVEMDAEEMETEEVEEVEETGVGAEKDRDGEMEVEETLKEAEKSADEVVMEEYMYNNNFVCK